MERSRVAAEPLSVAPETSAPGAPFPGAGAHAGGVSPRVIPAGPYVTVVLPCYNEQDHVLEEIARITKALDASGYTYELMAVDDKSTDETLARLREAEATHLPLRVVAFRRNGGSGTVRR